MEQTYLALNRVKNLAAVNKEECFISIKGWANISITMRYCSQLNAFTKRVQSNNSLTEYYTGEQLFYCYDSWSEKWRIRTWQWVCSLLSDARELSTIFHAAAAYLEFAFEFTFPLLNVTTYKHKTRHWLNTKVVRKSLPRKVCYKGAHLAELLDVHVRTQLRQKTCSNRKKVFSLDFSLHFYIWHTEHYDSIY